MKVTIEVHKTAELKPTGKYLVDDRVCAIDRRMRFWRLVFGETVTDWPEQFPLWFSLRGLPKPEPLRKRKKKS